MSSIAGFFHPFMDFTKENGSYTTILKQMSATLLHRGPDEQHFYYAPHAFLNHNRLSCGLNQDSGKGSLTYETLPATKKFKDNHLTIAYDGAIYNFNELTQSLRRDGVETKGLSDAELLLCAFIRYGTDFVQKLNGGFSIVIYDEKKNQLFLFRDPLGIKPLFYTLTDKTLVFSSELKGLFCHPAITPVVDLNGLNEIFSIGPAKTPGCGVFSDIYEIKPGHFLAYGPSKLYDECYFRFSSDLSSDCYEDALENVSYLVKDAVIRQMEGDAPLSCFLSGGLDSSVVTSICAHQHPDENIRTYSFDFKGNDQNFKANSFQPSLDAPFVQEMVDYLHTNHTRFECNSALQVDLLSASVAAHDLPCMADIDASLLYFCKLAAKDSRIVLTGECADELFCGYPWYHKKEMYEADTFPWSLDFSPRQLLLKDSFMGKLDGASYLEQTYQNACGELLFADDLSKEQRLHQKTFFLTVRWFMQTLLDRMDRAAAQTGLDARVPFADLRIAKYLFGLPYEFKTKDGEVKHLLRAAFASILPPSVCQRKKSPYPKTYDPGYEALLANRLKSVISNPNSPLLEFVEPKKVLAFCQNPKDYGKPWYGQLMAGPQLMAYYLQINEWIEKYQVQLKL
ncbi:asparagine synthase (glutamine-hydrolyzing) [Roseburia sp. 831b]|uniref:asparagine synthase (glutamine-hydrolyzing) n=1 Tax=Roseburia sp. 831b TaxID=1261635 RepID=UPI00095130ED|nr:asparagine synthase (glutamine-hydrolyzing) [Roseburia sp. 831b]WVK72043.1 asparagine synthase (glutamine-hydrolyzing) [Roseburia sp. 831b]